MLAPIVLFVYARVEHTKKVVDSLLKNPEASESDLYIFSDAPKNSVLEKEVNRVREYLNQITGFKSLNIEYQKKNTGLSRSIRCGVSKILELKNSVIVLEDDIEVSPGFLKFMNAGLRKYEDQLNVISISGYVYPVVEVLPNNFFIKGADCWGWGTWTRAWSKGVFDPELLLSQIKDQNLEQKFNYGNAIGYSSLLKEQANGDVDSWAICWHAFAFINGYLTLYPGKSLVQNIGNDGSGTHSENFSGYNHLMLSDEVSIDEIEVSESTLARKIFANYFRSRRKGLAHRIISKALLWIKTTYCF